jgi:DNA-binding CsgD family transcriptional regulator
MLPDSTVLSTLLGSLYEAAADPTLWDSFLRQLAHYSHAGSAALVMHDNPSGVHTVARNWEVDPEGTRLYQEHYGALDIWAMRAAGLSLQSWVGTSEQLCPFGEFSRSEYYNDFLQSLGIDHAAFALLRRASYGDAVLGIYRSQRRGEFGESELDLLRFLMPHVQRAFSLHLQISDLKARTGGITAALDMLPTGVLLVGARGEIVVMNQAASAILAKRDGLIATTTGLRAQCVSESNQLERLIRQGVNASAGKQLSPAGALLISRGQQPPLQLLICPTRHFPVDLANAACAVVFVTDPAQNERPAHDILCALFGLTPAEARVAMMLGDGNSPREIGQRLGVSSNTIKSQLASIYGKTGTSRQAQLVRLLMKLPTRATPIAQLTLSSPAS